MEDGQKDFMTNSLKISIEKSRRKDTELKQILNQYGQDITHQWLHPQLEQIKSCLRLRNDHFNISYSLFNYLIKNFCSKYLKL